MDNQLFLIIYSYETIYADLNRFGVRCTTELADLNERSQYPENLPKIVHITGMYLPKIVHISGMYLPKIVYISGMIVL
jgi:hypothetical protein